MASKSIKDQTISGIKWNGIEKMGVMGIQFVLTLILARLLTPEDYGIIGMLAIFIEVSRTFIDSGFSMALVRKTDVNERDFSTAFLFNVVVAIIIYGVLFVAAPAIASFFYQPALCEVLRIYAISLFINSLMAVQVSMLQIKLDFKSLAKRNVTATLLSGFIGIAMAYFGYGVWALVWQNLSAAIINLVLICYICRWYPREAFSMDSFRYLWSFGSRLLGSGLLHTFYQNMTSFAIGKFYTPQDLGFYKRGSEFAHVPTHAINGVLLSVTYPILSKIQDDMVRLMNVYKKYIRLSSLTIFFLCGLIAALADPLIILFLTEKWKGAIIFLQLFALGSMFDHLNTINLNLLKVKGRSDLFFRLEIIKKSISLFILFISIPFGVLAICISKLIYNQIAIVINTYYTGKLFHYGYIEQWKDFLPYFFKTVIACLPSFILSLTSMNDIVVVVVGIILSTLIYIFLLRKDDSFIEIKVLMIEKIPVLGKLLKYI